jgi:hypothetical protein
LFSLFHSVGRVGDDVLVPCDRRTSMKGSEKPKKLQKKAAQKTLKEKRSEKKAKAARR